MTDDRQEQTLTQQRELYGAPLGETVRSVTTGLGISQAAVARVIGVSPPMLSQLVSGQRIKLGNPQALQRLQSLVDLARDVAGGLAHDRIAPRLAEIEADTTGTLTASRAAAPSNLPAAFSQLLRAVASGRELAAAADLLEADHPDLSAVLRAYGTGRPEDAQRHFASVAHLL